ncbi:MAG: PIG-L deacetylase family protein [Bacteroidota bacterium]
MLNLDFDRSDKAAYHLLCLGAHCDDIEIGCGGTLLKLIENKRVQFIKWVVFTSNPERAQEARESAESFLKDVPEKEIIVLNFRDGFLPQLATEVKNEFEAIKKNFSPDIVFTHYKQDLHQDHRLLADMTWNTFRNHFILEYEIPKYDGDLGNPAFFVHLEAHQAKKKSDIMLECFKSQMSKHWFDEETFLALMRLRGMQSAAFTKYAEAFYVRKMVM